MNNGWRTEGWKDRVTKVVGYRIRNMEIDAEASWSLKGNQK